MNGIAVFVGEFAGNDFYQVNKNTDAENAGCENIKNTRSYFTCIETVCTDSAEEKAEKKSYKPIFFGLSAIGTNGCYIIFNLLAVEYLFNLFGHFVKILASFNRKISYTFYAFLHYAVFVNAHTVDSRFVLLNVCHDLDFVAVLDKEPNRNIEVRFFLKRNALSWAQI